ncbi:ceramide glucosyltransferase [Tabrizicola sp. TH137]|uniref:ceramide glucosyltransferase n=1 Tax=Tabrizicola sp. TH137 TaxID=2067452 RepID=UPI000C7B1B75|nr:ceramide glucosyltransferase [Tabrizicola sp. TH137]PLL12717.1 ceramide glucosyltransferase [Tabrizicola sp. TH137]
MTALALTLLALGFLALHLASALIVLARRDTPPAPGATAQRPRVTLLRPLCGRDATEEETLASTFALTWPDLEILFCVADPADPVIPLVRDLIARHPTRNARLLIGDDRVSANPKLNNLEKGWRAATGDFVVMADSNLLLPPDYFDRLLARHAPGIGLVTSPPIGIRPQGLWAALECAFLNSNQARLQLAADSLGQGFAQGKTMMWDRAFLDAHGGLAPLGARLAEDVAATRLVRGAGLRVALTARPFPQPIGRRSLAQVWHRQLRWSKVRRDGFPGLFLAEPLNGGLLPLLAIGAAQGLPAAALFALLWYGAETALAARAGWLARPAHALLFPLRDLMIPALWLATLRNTRFEWRGNLMAPGALHPAPQDRPAR